MRLSRRDLPVGLLAAVPGTGYALDGAQRQWIAQHPGLRFAPEADHGPFVFRTERGEIAGLSVDLLKLIVEQIGLGVAPLQPQPLAGVLRGLREGSVDFTSALRPTAETSQFLRFTKPYIDVPTVLAVRPGARLAGWEALSEGAAAVAVGEGYPVEAHVRQRLPKVRWVPVPSDDVAVLGVQEGRFAAAVLDVASLAFVVETKRLPRLHIAAATGFQYSMCFAVRKDLPELADVLDKGLKAISAERRKVIVDRWLGPYAGQLAAPSSKLAVGLGFGCLVALAGLGIGLAARRAGRNSDRVNGRGSG